MNVQQRHIRGRTPVAIAVIALFIAACGGSSRTTFTQAKPAAADTSSSSSGVGAATARMRATLTAANHTPIVGRNWPYSVRVTDAAGHPLSGRVRVQFAFGGRVVGTDRPPVHPLKDGRWHDLLKFPRASVGFPLTFQVVVHTGAGSVTLNWPVSVKP